MRARKGNKNGGKVLEEILGQQQRQRDQQFEGHSSFYARGEQSAQKMTIARMLQLPQSAGSPTTTMSSQTHSSQGLSAKIPMGTILRVDRICKRCAITLADRALKVDLRILDMTRNSSGLFKVEVVQEWERLTNVFEWRLVYVYCDASTMGLECVLMKQGKAKEMDGDIGRLRFCSSLSSWKGKCCSRCFSRKSYGQLSSLWLREFEMHVVIEDFELCLSWEGQGPCLYSISADQCGMKRDIAQYVANYQTSQQVKAEHQRPTGLLQPLPIPE
ncbi:hypothetical protein CK203_037038 [Vitis vinifera]|uniref:Uncharacterized protein n=1 Tax=Vitis vinifera TaxID=29760 RepID=A0A438I5T9_VITVI|nr:hypothetical protein CK203_037038 [Vitis vinifera]